MASITFQKMRKVYDDGTEAIPGMDLEVKDGEFMVFVGPSGCGKSTALRMTAGLEDISGGRLLIGDQVVNNKSPQERDIAMVFQDYALYPHMTVGQNMGFALKMMRIPKAEIRKRVEEAADRLSLTALLDRKPKNLSGGQRQRVVMGRAIVRQPQAFLMDEPLSNLDAKLRVQDARRDRRPAAPTRGHHAVRHARPDRGDDDGGPDRGHEERPHPAVCPAAGALRRAGQCVRRRLHRQPEGEPVHSILFRDGSGSATMQFGPKELKISAETLARWPGLRAVPDGPITVGLRPESFQYTPDADPEVSVDVQANVVEMLGNETLVHFVAPVEQASDADVRDRAQASDEEESILAGAGQTIMVSRSVPPVRLREGDPVRLTLDTTRLYLFDQQGDAIR
jgi:multiple sugar transport system ATP-binding protein